MEMIDDFSGLFTYIKKAQNYFLICCLLIVQSVSAADLTFGISSIIGCE